MGFKKPKRLKKGDTVAIISPSWGGASVFPHVYDLGIANIKSLGLKVKEFPSALATASDVYDDPKMRADDINAAFQDSEIKAIIATIGGDDSIRILKYLDKKSIQENPKLIMGYSDTTTLTTFFNQLGLITFNGPTVMSGFSEWKDSPVEFRDHVTEFLFDPEEIYEYKPYKQYFEEELSWNKVENAGKFSPPIDSKGWNWLQGDSVVKGRLFGGCIEVLEFMKGTAYWPRLDFWKDKIFFFETSEDKPTPEQVKWMVRNLGIQGILDKISAVVVGRAKGYNNDENQKLYENLKAVVSLEFGRSDMPIVTDLDFGHTNPQFIMPLGVMAELDCVKKSFRLLESPLL